MSTQSDGSSSTIEYRIGWSASSNASFSGFTDWEEWGGFEETESEVEAALYEQEGAIAPGLEEALSGSGFEWWVETRTAGA